MRKRDESHYFKMDLVNCRTVHGELLIKQLNSAKNGSFPNLKFDKEVADFVRDNPSEGDIQEIQKKRDLLTMPEDGVLKVLRGTTSLDELSRVVSLDT